MVCLCARVCQFLRQQDHERKLHTYKFLQSGMAEAEAWRQRKADAERREREQAAAVERGQVDAVVHQYAVRDAERRRRVQQLEDTVVRCVLQCCVDAAAASCCGFGLLRCTGTELVCVRAGHARPGLGLTADHWPLLLLLLLLHRRCAWHEVAPTFTLTT